jgi:hypothetical protein
VCADPTMAFPFQEILGRHHTTILQRLLGEVTERPLSQTECLDTNRVTNQVIFTGDASRSQPGCGEMGNSVFDGDSPGVMVAQTPETNGLLTVFGALRT